MELSNKSCEHGWPRRKTSLPHIPSTAEELETLPVTTYTPPQNESIWSTKSEDGETLRLVEPGSVHLQPPPSAYRGLVFRTTTPNPSSPPLRRKHGSRPLKDVAIFGDSTKRECCILSMGEVEINIITPTPPTSPRSSPKKKLKLPHSTSRGNKLKRRSLIILAAIEERRRFSGTTKKPKRNSLVLYRQKLPAKFKSTRNSKLLVPKTRCSQFFEHDFENDGEMYVWDDIELGIHTADGFPAPQTEALPSPELPFTTVYRQILERRWSCYHKIDSLRADDEKRSVAEFMAKTYTDMPYADHALHYPPPRPKSAVRSLPLLNTQKATKASRRLTISSPKLFPSEKEMEKAKEEVRKERKKHFWSRPKREHTDAPKAAKRLARGEYEKEPKKLSEVGRNRLSILPEDELRRISVYRTDAGLRVLGL